MGRLKQREKNPDQVNGDYSYLKVDIVKILGKLPWMSKIPFQGKGTAAIMSLQKLHPTVYTS